MMQKVRFYETVGILSVGFLLAIDGRALVVAGQECWTNLSNNCGEFKFKCLNNQNPNGVCTETFEYYCSSQCTLGDCHSSASINFLSVKTKSKQYLECIDGKAVTTCSEYSQEVRSCDSKEIQCMVPGSCGEPPSAKTITVGVINVVSSTEFEACGAELMDGDDEPKSVGLENLSPDLFVSGDLFLEDRPLSNDDPEKRYEEFVLYQRLLELSSRPPPAPYCGINKTPLGQGRGPSAGGAVVHH